MLRDALRTDASPPLPSPAVGDVGVLTPCNGVWGGGFQHRPVPLSPQGPS